jgi:hypothetical protein
MPGKWGQPVVTKLALLRLFRRSALIVLGFAALAKCAAFLGLHVGGLLSANDNADWQGIVSSLGALGGVGAAGGGGANPDRNAPTGGSGDPPGQQRWRPVLTSDQGTWSHDIFGTDPLTYFPQDVVNDYRVPQSASDLEWFSIWLQKVAGEIAGEASGTTKATSSSKA